MYNRVFCEPVRGAGEGRVGSPTERRWPCGVVLKGATDWCPEGGKAVPVWGKGENVLPGSAGRSKSTVE